MSRLQLKSRKGRRSERCSGCNRNTGEDDACSSKRNRKKRSLLGPAWRFSRDTEVILKQRASLAGDKQPKCILYHTIFDVSKTSIAIGDKNRGGVKKTFNDLCIFSRNYSPMPQVDVVIATCICHELMCPHRFSDLQSHLAEILALISMTNHQSFMSDLHATADGQLTQLI